MENSLRKLIFVVFGLVAIVIVPKAALGQEKSVFTQYMFNGLAINPAYAGSQNVLNATALYRNQWVGVEGAPNTQTFSIHSATKKKKVGIGLFMMRDAIGVHSDFNLYGCYSYKIKVSRNAILSMGIQGGFNNLTSNYNELKLKSNLDPVFGSDNKFSPNFGSGLYYYLINKGFVGFSVPYMLKSPVLPKELNRVGKQARYYLLSAGYVFDLNKDLKLKPSTLIRLEEGAPLGVDVNANLIIKELIFVGYSYRTGDSMSFLTQIQLTSKLQMGYSYDYTTSGLNRFSRGSHEILLNYRINLFPEKCATYF